MKKAIVALFTLTLFVISCAPKAAKTPTAETPALTGISTNGGALIASAKCTKCHGNNIDHIATHTFDQQEKLMHKMAKKARLSPQETADLMAYVLEYAKKG